MTCSSCRRQVVIAWYRDGTTERICTGCINRALREAGRVLEDAEYRTVLDRMRRMGFA